MAATFCDARAARIRSRLSRGEAVRRQTTLRLVSVRGGPRTTLPPASGDEPRRLPLPPLRLLAHREHRGSEEAQASVRGGGGLTWWDWLIIGSVLSLIAFYAITCSGQKWPDE